MNRLVTFLLTLSSLVVWGQSAPVVSSITPNSGAQGDMGIGVTIFGASFASTPTIDLGTGISVSSVTYLTSSLLSASLDISPTAPVGPHNLIVTNPDGLADTLVGGFTVLPEIDPPTADMLFPPACDMFISCRDTFIQFLLHDENGIDDTTLVVNVNGTDYTTLDPELILMWDTLGFFIPSSWFPHGDTIDFSIVRVADTFGNVATSPLNCRFIIDTLGPTIYETEPPMGLSMRDLVPTIMMPIEDSLSGVDSTSFSFTVIVPDSEDTFRFTWGSASLFWDRDTLVWEASVAGLTFADSCSLRVCLHAEDLVPIEGCGANALDTCWSYYLYVPPPTDVDLTIGNIYNDLFPLITAHCIVEDEDERIIEGLDESNFTVWEKYDADWVQQYPIVVDDSPIGCGKVDIVLCIDTTGSMSSMIDDVRTGLYEFVDSIGVAGISYRLGMNTFGDGVNFPHGFTLTGDLATFDSWIGALGSSGGGDGPETSLDAIMQALDSMEFRAGATIAIIMVTDAPYHLLGDPTSYSDVTPSMVLANLQGRRAMCFVVADTGSFGWYSPPYDSALEWYTMLCDSTGGHFFPWSGPGDFILTIPIIIEAVRGYYNVSWTSARPVADCQLRDVKIRLNYYPEYPDSLADSGYVDYLGLCSPAAAIVEPQPMTWTSDPLQPIIMTFVEVEDSINASSIQFMVEGTIYSTVSSWLNYTDPYLTWTHTIPFTNRQQVDAELVRVMDSQGNLPFSGPIRWYFWADLMPPRIANQSPAEWEIVYEHQPQICFDLWDEESGLNVPGVVFAIDCRQSRSEVPPILVMLDYNSPGVTVNGNSFCWDPSVEGYTFWDRDTVCITIIRAEDSPDYGEPNALPDSLQRWCFIIPDDDTICPEFSALSPDSTNTMVPNTPFYIQAEIFDSSGINHAWIEWDNDGDLDDGTFNITEMENIGGNIWQTISQIPGQSEGVDFVYQVWACDDDIDQDDSTDMMCCASDVMQLLFGLGPQAEIIRPQPLTWTTNADQEIVMHLYDDTAVDPATIVLNVAGQDYTVDGVELIYDAINESLFFYPQPAHYFTDGQTVDVKLVSADDVSGSHLQGDHQWHFYVDLTPPVLLETDPQDGEVIYDEQNPVMFILNDQWRLVDSTSIVLLLYDRTLYWGDDALLWNNDTLIFMPHLASPEFKFPNGDTVCAKLVCSDVEPDYGAPNRSDTLQICFIYALTQCDCRPIILTPNGDGKNDKAFFKYPNMVYGEGIVHIFDIEGEEIYKSQKGNSVWDCRSNKGRIVKPGIYIYMIEVDGEAVCNGTITVVR